MKEVFQKNKSFSLIELLIVIAIIGLLASFVFVRFKDAAEQARIAKAVQIIRQMRTAVELYAADTGNYPQFKCSLTCTKETDPFSTSLGVAGWSGPYFSMWNAVTPWGGRIDYFLGADEGGSLSWDVSDPELDCSAIAFDDDFSSYDDNIGKIPDSSLLRIDQILDDGNLRTGNIRAGTDLNGPYDWTGGLHTMEDVAGEMTIKIGCYNNY